MAEKQSSPGWIARGTAVVGTVLTALGLVLGYLNYRWQRELQEQSTAERILVRLDASRTIKNLHSLDDLQNLNNLLNSGSLPLEPKGEVGMEITNIGLRPLFIKRADMRIGGRTFIFHEHDPFGLLPKDDPAKTNEATKLLEASEATRYPLSWDFSEFSLGTSAPDSPLEDIQVQIQTTKGAFVLPHQFVTQIAYTAEFRQGNKKVQVRLDVQQGRKSPSKQSPDH